MDNTFKTVPFPHQLAEWTHHSTDPTRAILWEQGTGKSKLIIDTASALFRHGYIDGVLIIAPNGVQRTWIDQELPTHLPDDIAPRVVSLGYQTHRASTRWHRQAVHALLTHDGLSWLAISYDAAMTAAGRHVLSELFSRRRLLYVLDESHYIKTPSAARTKAILRAAQWASYRRILTGTPIAQGPFDVYTQIRFLEPDYWRRYGISTFTEFKNYFGVFRTRYGNGMRYDELVAYRRLDRLYAMLQPISSRVTKDDVLRLPPKLYTKRYFSMSPEQSRLYRQLRDEYIVWLEASGETVIAPLAITRLLRLQQIACGYLPTGNDDDPSHIIAGANHRLNALLEIVEESQHPLIVWARFRMDINIIMDALRARNIRAVRYDGAVSDDERARAVMLFQHDSTPAEQRARVFVGNPAAGGHGLTLTAAKTVVYYSNSFHLLDRLQSEDRAHRIGQDNSVLYIDLVAEGSIDEHIVEALRRKHDIAREITGDKLKEWI